MSSSPRISNISLITAPELNIDFLWELSFAFLALAALYFISIFLIRNKIDGNSIQSKQKKIELSPILSEFLFYEDTCSKEEKQNYLNLKIQIRELIKDDFDRKVLTEILLDLRKDLSGQSQQVLMNLYKDLGIHNDAFEKLTSRRWQIISKGILELTAMEVMEAYMLIVKFINHKQSTIRKQAEIAVVTLQEEGISYFLDNTKYKISEWQQLKLLDVLRHKPNFKPPHFSLWLTSNNTHVVLFALRLIKYYRQSNAEQSIITLLKHKKKDIQCEAIDCIKEFYFVNALPTLKLVYPKAPLQVKISILDAIGEIGSQLDIEFLEAVRKKEKSFIIKSKVLGTLNKISPESILPFKNIDTHEYFMETDNIEDHSEKQSNAFVAAINEKQSATEFNADLENLEKETSKTHILKETIDESPCEDHLIDTMLEVSEAEDISSQSELQKIDVVDPLEISTRVPVEGESAETVVEKEKASGLITAKQPGAVEEEPINLSQQNDLEYIRELKVDFLPLVVAEAIKIIPEAEESSIEVNPLFDLDDSHPEESSIEIESEPLKELNEIDISSFPFEEELEIDSDLIGIKSNTSVSFENNTISFSPNFLEEDELEKMVLLEQISDMGDHRELPFLRDLIKESTSGLLMERTKELIDKFSANQISFSLEKNAHSNLNISVFSEIFKLSDTETQLLLLEEINVIGDEKEIPLLKSLVADQNKQIALKAKQVLEHLEYNLNEKKTKVLLEASVDSLFKVDFELDIECKANGKIHDDGATLFDQLCYKSNSLYNKLNGK